MITVDLCKSKFRYICKTGNFFRCMTNAKHVLAIKVLKKIIIKTIIQL